MNIRTLSPQQSFLDTLAAMLLSTHAADPLTLAKTVVLLPSRRSCRGLSEAFLRQSGEKALLLPRILPIGEVDGEADIVALSGEAPPPAMPRLRRQAILTRLIMQQGETSPARACELAVELARLLDEVIKYRLNFAKLPELVPTEDLAKHWQQTTDFLAIITRHWPRILEEEGMVDEAAATRDRMLQLASAWEKNPPDFPVIAAGSTGSHPATSALLAAIARMPNGMVILPGLDTGMHASIWDQLDPTHPQYGLRNFLQEAGIERTHIAPVASHRPLSILFSPAALTAGWREASVDAAKDFAPLSLMQADTQNDEARMIAYQLREALGTPGKTAALVTPDRTLARMVASQCARYGIAIDDSAGQPLIDAPATVFMRLLAGVAASGGAPLPLLALLRHPLTAAGADTATAREMSRALETACLRGVRLTPGMDALAEEVKQHNHPGLLAFITRLRDMLRPLEMLFLRNAPCPLAELLAAHCAAAEAVAHDLWDKESGEALAALLAEWRNHAALLSPIAPRDYPALFDTLVAREVTRRPFGTHPRLHILSPIEARLLSYDRVILGGMNEGTWPTSAAIDPWMSAPMREAFGLPPHAVEIGRSAHDVWMQLHAPEVILSRARKISGTPQEPSRWWVRLVTLAGGALRDISGPMQATLEAQDAPYAASPLERPAPVPPAAARPRKFSPSSIDLWDSEPYAFYAKYILKLAPLKELDQEPDNREFGELIHSALEHFSAEYPNALPEHAYQLLLAHGQREFQPYIERPAVAALWWPRFEAIARLWLTRERELRQETYSTQSEVSARWDFTVAGEAIAFTARADRVDVAADGFRLIDYKTGTPPTKAEVEKGEAKQLPLTALALMRSGKISRTPKALIYWALKTRGQSKDFVEIAEAAELLQRSEQELFAMIEASLTASTDYAAATNTAGHATDYDGLIRRDEWGNS